MILIMAGKKILSYVKRYNPIQTPPNNGFTMVQVLKYLYYVWQLEVKLV